MPLWLFAVGTMVVLAVGYLTYGRWVARQYRLDDGATTPAVKINDGLDFIPTRPFYLLGQHFSAIAAAGPIAGPILACGQFGWLPCLLWILLGVVLIGAVHDFSALIASVRHGAHSIAEIAKAHLGRRAWLALIVFIWIALVYVIIAFTQITAQSFVGKAEEIAHLNTTFNKGGAVAAASVLYLGLSLVLGLVQRFLKPPGWLVGVIFVPATLGCVYAGTLVDELLVLPIGVWFVLILGYCAVAAMLPMWLLQQPRGYLGGWVLYLAIGVGVVGILFGGFGVKQPAISDQAWQTLNPASYLRLGADSPPALTSFVFPFLFVTIACGACSGFHGLICGGTTSKQIAKESHCQPIGFGAMLLEGFVAVIALATIMMLTSEQSRGVAPARIYGDGLAEFLAVLLGKNWFQFAATFGAMAFSTFVFDTLDVSTRLGRYLLVELASTLAGGRRRGVAGGEGETLRAAERSFWLNMAAACATAALPLVFLLTTDPEGYRLFWTLFGTSNQLLASLTLLGIYVWLRKEGKRARFTLAPMLFVFTITVSALGLQIIAGARDLWRQGVIVSVNGVSQLNTSALNGAVAVALLGLAVVFVVEARRALRGVGGRASTG